MLESWDTCGQSENALNFSIFEELRSMKIIIPSLPRLLMNVAGTSAATPTVAGMIALANDARLNAGKSVLGFLNPFIYQNPDIFFDVTLGDPSQACWLNDLDGYSVSEGWDPVTGFGTPDYHRLVAAAMKCS